MINYLYNILISDRMTRCIRFFFDLAIFMCIVALAYTTIFSLVPASFLGTLDPYIHAFSPQEVISMSLRILIIIKVYTILQSYL